MSALVRWLPELAVATADDIAQFGPQAARVRTLLDFLPTMSDDAARVSREAWTPTWDGAWDAEWTDAVVAATSAARNDALKDAMRAAHKAARRTAWTPAMRAAESEVVSDLISPKNYRALTNPLAAGRAVDVLAPRYKDTPFQRMLRDFSDEDMITQPSDVLNVARIAGSPEEIRDIALQLLKDGGMTLEEAYQAARLLA